MSPGALHAGCSAGHMGSMDNATWLNMWMTRMWQRTLKRLVLEKRREWNLDVSIVRMCPSCDGLRSSFHSKETSSSYLNMFLQTRKPKKNLEGSYWSGIVWAIIPWLSWPILAIRLSFTKDCHHAVSSHLWLALPRGARRFEVLDVGSALPAARLTR